MSNPRAYSRYSIEVASLLGKHIKLRRKRRRWTESNLSDRCGISRATLQKIERGDMSCALGLVLETAALVGVRLFDSEPMDRQMESVDDKIALLPGRVYQRRQEVHDDF